MNYHIPLLPNTYYHIFNRAIGDEKLFRSDENMRYFHEKMLAHCSPISQTIAYCLLPNHYHMVVKIFPETQLEERFLNLKENKVWLDYDTDTFIMEQFSNFQNSYVKAFNKMYGRRGGLFMQNLKRRRLDSYAELKNAIIYVHNNPIEHAYVDHIHLWKWNSYNLVTEDNFSSNCELEKLFSSYSNFVSYHK